MEGASAQLQVFSDPEVKRAADAVFEQFGFPTLEALEAERQAVQAVEDAEKRALLAELGGLKLRATRVFLPDHIVELSQTPSVHASTLREMAVEATRALATLESLAS